MGLFRLLLAVSVVVAHSSPVFGITSVGGIVAVQSFYIVSGFYMSLILNEKYANTKRGRGYWLFISNRLLRLYPVYWVVALLVLLTNPDFFWWFRHMLATGELALSSFLFLVGTNIAIFFQDAVMFLGLDTHTGHLFFTPDFRAQGPWLFIFLLVPQAWTLGVELLFYVIAPFVVRRGLSTVAALAIASIGLRILIANVSGYGYDKDPWVYRFFPTELVFFLAGNLSYRLLRLVRERTVPPVLLRIAYWVLPVIVTCWQFIPPIEQGDDVSWPKHIVFFALLVVALPFLFQATKNNKLDNFIGELSYPIYISHLFVMALIESAMKRGWVVESSGTTLVLATIVFSLVINAVVARPIERIRQRRVKNAAARAE